MKTAMQELIDWFQLDTDKWDKDTQKRANELLKKEKEQIMDAWYNGFDELRPYVDNSEEYYNKTYNQNK